MAATTYRAIPEVAFQAIDVRREKSTRRLYCLEINPGGNTWNFSSARAQAIATIDGIRREDQLGALGLVIVLLRGVWERRAELALFQALGFRKGKLAWLVLAENGFLLAAGLGIGAFTAVVAVLPHVISGGSLVWQRLALSLGCVVVVGLTAALAAVTSTLRAPILTALRRE